MRILHTIHSMSLEGGGPTEVVRQLAQTAVRTNTYQTEVVTLDDPRETYLQCEGVPIHAVGPGIGKYGYAPELDQWLNENLRRFDGVVVNGLWQYHGLASWRACGGRVPYLVYAHGMLDPWFKHAYPTKHLKKALYWEAAERRLLRDATAVLFTSPTEAKLAPNTFRGSEWNAFTVPNGTLGPAGDREVQIREFFAACPAVRNKSFLLFIGRIHKKKGCDLLIQAFGALASRSPDLDLVVAGPDEEGWVAELSRLAETSGVGSRVHFPGMLKGDAKWGAFFASQAFVLPSHQENFGVAVAEALACATPVLISNKVNIWPNIVEDAVGLVEEDDLQGTVRLLDRWLALPTARRLQMAARCQASFQSRYDMKQVPKVIVGLFTGALHGERVGSAQAIRKTA
jgi:glycosyltransferase involved in cell wall biosynthesis